MSLNIKSGAPVTPTPLEKIKENVTKAGAWIWEHKKWVVLAVATTTGVILLVKKRTAIKDFFQSLHIEKLTAKSAVSEIAEENVPSIPCDALSHRTGNMLTATKLGGKVGVSNREINKRLVAAGLAVRLPCGAYVLTENGKLLGESGLKVTPWNYTLFSRQRSSPLLPTAKNAFRRFSTKRQLDKTGGFTYGRLHQLWNVPQRRRSYASVGG